jgi:hemoglobin
VHSVVHALHRYTHPAPVTLPPEAVERRAPGRLFTFGWTVQWRWLPDGALDVVAAHRMSGTHRFTISADGELGEDTAPPELYVVEPGAEERYREEWTAFTEAVHEAGLDGAFTDAPEADRLREMVFVLGDEPWQVAPVTLYDVAGGGEAFLNLATAHHARCLADPELNHPFSHAGQHPQHVERLAAYWAEVLGGPPAFTRTHHGDEAAVLHMHAHNGDMADLGERFVACFAAAMDDAGLPAHPAFREAMSGYMRWATDRVLAVSPHGAAVPEHAEIPHWGWDGPVPAPA